MRRITHQQLHDFCKGQVNDPERLQVEDFLFSSKPGLMEFFTIKRELDLSSVELQFSPPSELIRARLRRQVSQRKERAISRKQALIASGIVFAFALSAFFMRDHFFGDYSGNETTTDFSIDSTNDLLAGHTFM